MKRVLIVILVLATVLSITACSGSDSSRSKTEQTSSVSTDTQEETAEKAEETAQQNEVEAAASKSAKFELLSCRFSEDIHALDDEYIGNHYSSSEKTVFVDAVFDVKSAGSSGISEKNVSGNLWYDDKRYDLTYCKNSKTETIIDDDPMEANDYRQIHLFAKVPKEAQNAETLSISYSIDGIEGTANIDPMDTANALVKKTELKEGDDLSAGGIDVIVYRCTMGKLLTADEKKSNQYSGDYMDLVLKLTNNNSDGFYPSENLFKGYVVSSDGTIVRANDRLESEDNVSLDNTTEIAPGTTRYYHIMAKSDNSGDGIFRFNDDGKCYYIKAEKW